MQRAAEKHKWVKAEKSKPKALQHFKVDNILKIDETFISRLNLCAIEVFLRKIAHLHFKRQSNFRNISEIKFFGTFSENKNLT